MSETNINLGPVSAYALAKTKGYTGTEAEFAQLMANYATVGQQAAQSAAIASTAANTANTKASEAATSANNAATSATNASRSATAASQSATAASNSASSAATSAQTANAKSTEATNSANAASQSAGSASQYSQQALTARTAAQAAQTAAESAKTAAEAAAQDAHVEYTGLSNTVSSMNTTLNSRIDGVSDDVDDLSDVVATKASTTALQAETARATAEESRIEALFTAPTEEAVADWLEAHPEATTTVQDGAISYAKLDSTLKAKADDVDDLKSSLEVYPKINHEIAVAITASMLELGRIDDSGNPVAHSSRCRTKDFIPVFVGDTLSFTLASGPASTGTSIIVTYYDKSKAFLSKTDWIYFNASITKFLTVQNDGYIKCTFNSANFSVFDGLLQISRTSKSTAEMIALESKLKPIIPLPKEAFVYGYWLPDGIYKFSIKRVRNYYPIKVFEGDEIYFTSFNSLLVDIGFQKSGDTAIVFDEYGNMPFKATSDGLVYVNYKNEDDSDISDYSDLNGMIAVCRKSEIERVENAVESKLYNGYVNDSGIICAHNTRLVNWQPIHANKGDIVRLNHLDVCMYVYEFDRKKILLASSGNYIYPIYKGGRYPLCGDYVVQNDDCWIMCTIAPSGTAPSSFKPSDYPNVFSVIHIEKNKNLNTAEDTYFRFPKAPRKGEKLNTEAIASQGMTFVNGELWSAVDSATDYISVIDPKNGEIKRTITHNLGHCNSLDYCPDTDCIITTTANGTIVNPKIIIVPNVSAITDSIDLSDCLQITVDATQIDLVATICFGQDPQEAWIYTGYGSTNPYNLYKIVLEYADGAYTGNVLSYTKYTGVIRDNIDTHVMTGTRGYAQDCCYDGYFYLGYGTAGHNFLVIDIDDVRHTYQVVGNYLHKMHDATHAEFGVEPEGVAIYDGKVYCSSRSNSKGLSYFMLFDLL